MKIKLRISYSLCLILLGIFSFMRVYRNSIGYASTNVGGIWNAITLIYVMFAIFFILGISGKRHGFPKPIITALLFSLISQINVLFNIDKLSISTVYNFIMIGYFAVILVVFYSINVVGNDKKEERITLIVFSIIAVITYISVFWFRSWRIAYAMVSNAYYLLCFMPLFMQKCRNKKLQLLAYTIVGLVIAFSGKRTGFIAYAMFIFIIAWFRVSYNKNASDFIKTVLLLTGATIAFFVVYVKIDSAYNLGLLKRMTTIIQDGGSGRIDIYRQIWEGMKSSNITEWLIGHGYAKTSTVLLYNDTAHNDFLEILYDYGLLPTVLFIVFYIQLLIEGLKMIRVKYEYGPVYIGGVMISLLLSMFSTYCISYAYVSCGMAFLGVALRDWKRFQKEYKSSLCDKYSLIYSELR